MIDGATVPQVIDGDTVPHERSKIDGDTAPQANKSHGDTVQFLRKQGCFFVKLLAFGRRGAFGLVLA